MQKTFLGFGQPSALAAALVLWTLLGGCSSSAITGQQAADAAAGGRDATHGAGGIAVSNGGAGGRTSDPAEDGGGPGGAAGGTPGAGGATGSGGGVSGGGGIGATGGRPGSGGRSGAGGSSGADAGVDASSSCPAQLPIAGVACQGSVGCSYGQMNCCGHSSSAWTCTCSGGSFLCSPTECNIICPGQDASGSIDSSIDTSTERDTSPADSAGVGAACGGPSDPPCTGFTFCDWSDNRCGTGVHGACATIPRGVLCAISPAPVCGCNGQNYLGGCQATQAGVDVSTTASCPPPAGWFRCGWTYCQHNAQYCSAQVGGAVSNPGAYACVALPAACNGSASCSCTGGNGLICSTNAQGDVTVTQEVP